MRIKKLELKNFRGFEDLTIDFPEGESGLAVFVGVNGSGKTSVLDSIVHLLNEYLLKLTEPFEAEAELSSISPLKPRDVRIGQKEAKCSILMEIRNFEVIEEINIETSGRITKIKDREHANSQEKIISEVRSRLENIEWFAAPIIAYYSASRFVEEPELKVIDIKSISLRNVYKNSLESSINFKSFFDWFRSTEDIENENRLFGDNSYRDKGLDSVRIAITNFIGDIKNPRVRRQPSEELIIEKGDLQLSFQNLSSGERGLIALVGDIAKRLSCVFWNNPLEGDGVVLIDEIEQHLHPSWQRTIIPNLRRTFPNIQFILTTHSPQVLSNVPRENVFILKDFKLEKNKPHTEGRDSNAILEDIFDVPSRPEEEKNELAQLYDAIEKGEKKIAEKLFVDLKKKLGDRDLELLRAESYMDVL